MKVHYFLGTRLLASCHEYTTWDGVQRLHASLALVCPACGEVWGRVHVEGMEWLPLRASCHKHPSAWVFGGGSFLLPWNPNQLNELPLEVLVYEFQLRMKDLK